ncbi:2-hydroxyacid dehydrogenase [Bradyrhizobium cenepequi]
MKVALFSTHEFEREFFMRANIPLHHELLFNSETLHQGTAVMAKDIPAVCVFLTDELDAATLSVLARGGTKLLALRSAGYNNVDLEAAARLGITVVRVPAYAPAAIAEHAIALMLTLNRHIHKAYNRVREGNFDLNGLLGFNMSGKTIGIVGTGKIGTALARIMRGFDCELLGYDVIRNPDCIDIGVRYVDLQMLLAKSDIVSLHCPLTSETKHLINEHRLGLMKPRSMLINTARGAIVDAHAVMEALKNGGPLLYFGMDVYEEEDSLFFSDRSSTIISDDVFERLTTFPNVVITGHQAFLTREALTAIAHVTLCNVSDFEAGHLKAENIVAAKGIEARQSTDATASEG